ncbi:MAG TPA: hypothetical protein VND97_08405 [Beijerinckiaceae bacterium]|nr:hypothetical protein [Beijerinckiaceae bacterium]
MRQSISDYAILNKIYGTLPEAAKGRYSPAVCLGAKKDRIEGNPDPTPAMASGLSETVMDWSDFMEMIDADQPAKKRGPYKKAALQIHSDPPPRIARARPLRAKPGHA